MKTFTKMLNLRWNEEWIKKLADVAEKNETTIAFAMREALKSYIKKNK